MTTLKRDPRYARTQGTHQRGHAQSYGPSYQRLQLHRTRVCQSGGDVPVFRQPEPGGCPHPQLTGLTTKALQT